ncbi:MAG: radical SAM protein [Clostridia bacterium]|nr:radical SAM protein [Clostridia bacterium]
MEFFSLLFKKKENGLNKKNKIFEAIQVEVSSVCNLKCKFCPTTYLNEKGENMLMSWETFQKLQSLFSKAKWVYLQGWGEPLLHPKIWEMVAMIKKEGARVGFTTNGTLLNEKAITNLIEYQVDLISTSIAGATSQTHEKLRCNSNFQNICNSIKSLVKKKKMEKSKKPLVTLSYMLIKENIVELPQAVKLAYELGVEDIYTTNLDYVFSEEANQSKIFVWDKSLVNSSHEEYIQEAKKFAQSKDFTFRSYPIILEEEQAVCALNPSKLVFITANGDVTPCTYLGRKYNPRYYKNKYVQWPRKVFGNINDQEFIKIWENPVYKEFRNKFENRVKAYEELISVYTDYEPNLTKINNAQRNYYQRLKENPLPMECQSCPKIYGI